MHASSKIFTSKPCSISVSWFYKIFLGSFRSIGFKNGSTRFTRSCSWFISNIGKLRYWVIEYLKGYVSDIYFIGLSIFKSFTGLLSKHNSTVFNETGIRIVSLFFKQVNVWYERCLILTEELIKSMSSTQFLNIKLFGWSNSFIILLKMNFTW